MLASERKRRRIIGMLFGPYRLLRRIGLGELAEVFVASRQAPQGGGPPLELVAVKRVSREMAQYQQVFDLFAREGELGALMRHPNVVRIFDYGTISGRPYIAMEYIPGADLAHLIGRLAPATVPTCVIAKLILDLCAALQYVHDACDAGGRPLGVVHGDVTPTNILVSTDGEAKLIDFSVASSDLGSGRDSTVRGTYAYMSPEQVRGEVIDRRSDVFSLGVVLWELLAGRRLFRRNANYLTLAAVVEDPVPRLAELGLALPGVERLDGVLMRALAKQREERYGQVAELAAALRPVIEELGWDLQPWTVRTAIRELLSETRLPRPAALRIGRNVP